VLRRASARLLTSPAAFLIAGIVDVAAVAGGALASRLRARR
jgi:hypothetical protein